MANSTTGDYLIGAQLTSEIKSTSSLITKGDVMTVQSNVWATAGTSSNNKGPFRVAAETVTAAASQSTIASIREGIVYVTAGGTIQPGSLVVCDSSTAGRVMAYTSTVIPTTPLQADVQAARDEYKLAVGVYLGHENEGSIGSPATAASSGDVIRIDLRGKL
jgi:hypothetical protein